MRELVVALQEDDIVPTADSAIHVERIGARTVGRSVLLRLRRLPEPAGKLPHAVAILERGDLLQAAKLAELGPTEASLAADMLAAAGTSNPVGRSLSYTRSSGPASIASFRAQSARRGIAQLLASSPSRRARTSASRSISSRASPPATLGRSNASWRPPGRPRGAVRLSRRRYTPARTATSLRRRASARASYSRPAWPRQAPGYPAGGHIYERPWTAPPTMWRAPPRREFSRRPWPARSARQRRSRSSTAPRPLSIQMLRTWLFYSRRRPWESE